MELFKLKLRNIFEIIMRTSLINRWIVLAVDLLLCFFGFLLSVLILQLNNVYSVELHAVIITGSVFFSSLLAAFLIAKPYRGLIRHSNLVEMWRVVVSILFSSIILYLFVLIVGCKIPHSFLFIQNIFFISVFLLLLMRYCVVQLYNYSVNYTIEVRNKLLVYEINMHSIALAQWLNKSESKKYQAKGFVTRNKDAKRTRIQGLPVHYMVADNMDWFLRKNEINTILFPDYQCVRKEKEFVANCLDRGLTVLVSPPFEDLDSNNKVQYQMKPIQFEDLLGREEIQIDLDIIEAQTNNKTILITGAAGSIGSELVRQLAAFNPQLLLFFDTAETPLHNLRLEMERSYPELKFEAIIGDVRNETMLDFVFRKYNPQIVYHAAAYKHVPLMEENPCEAILTNVQGTMNLSNIAAHYNVESFVMISTDKAVNPTNIMGASKRIAEIYVQSLAEECRKKGMNISFVTTRFGNVLGSNGSVIPYFKEQIEKGGPVTVTHPDIIRYFMTIPEACRLVLEAASFGNSGEIYVFDMGSPVKIVDLAKRMIELAGFVPGKDIQIEYIGLRPGEKLYEELLNDKEHTIPTKHEKITVATVRKYEYEKVLDSIQELIQYSNNFDVENTVRSMKKLVSEFKSKNSPFSEFDV